MEKWRQMGARKKGNGERRNCARKIKGRKKWKENEPSNVYGILLFVVRFKFFYLIYSRESIPILLKYITSSYSLFLKMIKT